MENEEVNELVDDIYKQCIKRFENYNTNIVIQAIAQLVIDIAIHEEWDVEDLRDFFTVTWKTIENIKDKGKSYERPESNSTN